MANKEQRIAAAVEAAEGAFWAEIVKAFPEITTGDFPPDATFAFSAAMTQAVRVWVWGNSPEEEQADDNATNQ